MDLTQVHEVSEEPYLIWLASYPKSGNTWLRAVIEAYYNNGELVSFEKALSLSVGYGARPLLNEFLGFGTGDMSCEQLHYFRKKAYRYMAERRAVPRFVKIHEAYRRCKESPIVIPPSVSRGIVYLARNPLDVLHSYAYHSGVGIERMCAWLNQDDFVTPIVGDRYAQQIPQWLLNWSEHVRSWTEQNEVPVLLVRYEDLIQSPEASFLNIFEFIEGGAVDREKLRRSIEACRFERMCQLEVKTGFLEAASSDRPFFREGKVGRWQDLLSKDVVERVVQKHSEVMLRLGYL